MAPTFGTERRGAPVMTSLKLSREKIYDLSPIETPDIVVVLDHLLLKEADVTNGLKKGGLIIMNTPKNLEDYSLEGFTLAIADITAISIEAGLPHGVVNTGIIGSLEKAAGLVGIDILLKGINSEFTGRKPAQNAKAAQIAFERTIIGD
jgi:2-oxoacid:acceptor oxidoreductase gamma subunit (pyruvate/2-ketoisovalerate family)